MYGEMKIAIDKEMIREDCIKRIKKLQDDNQILRQFPPQKYTYAE